MKVLCNIMKVLGIVYISFKSRNKFRNFFFLKKDKVLVLFTFLSSGGRNFSNIVYDAINPSLKTGDLSGQH